MERFKGRVYPQFTVLAVLLSLLVALTAGAVLHQDNAVADQVHGWGGYEAVRLSVERQSDGGDASVVAVGTELKLTATAVNLGDGVTVQSVQIRQDGNVIASGGNPLTKSNHDAGGPDVYTFQAVAVFRAENGQTMGKPSVPVDVEVVAVDRIIINGSDPEEGGPVYIALGESITLRAMPDPEGSSFPAGWPQWTIEEKPDGSELGDPAVGATAAITPDEPGEYVVKAACGDSSATFTVVALKFELLELTFNSDHGMLRDNTTDYTAAGELYGEPEWTSGEGGDNHPISHTMDDNVQVTLKIKVSPDNAPEIENLTITGEGPQGFNFESNISLEGGDNSVALTSTDKVEEKIQIVNGGISWKIKRDDHEWYAEETGPHVVYVTMGTPRNDEIAKHRVTEKRMERAVSEAGAVDSLDPGTIIGYIVQAQGAFDLDAFQENAWLVPDNDGDCGSIVRLAIKVANMINIPGEIEHRNIYAIETAPETAIVEEGTHGGLSQDQRNHPVENWRLFLEDGNGKPNNFEAAARVSHGGITKYYAGGVVGAPPYDDPDDILKVFKALSWYEWDDANGEWAHKDREHVYNP